MSACTPRLSDRGRRSRLLTGLVALVLVAACSKDAPLPGERIPVRPEAPGVAAGPRAIPIALPPATVNADWSHRNGAAQGRPSHPALAAVRKAHAEGCASVEAAGRWLAANHAKNPAVPGAVAYSMLMLLGTVTGGWQLARAAVIASEKLAAGGAENAAEKDFLAAKLITADFYAGQFSPLATAYLRAIEAGSDALVAFPDSQF